MTTSTEYLLTERPFSKRAKVRSSCISPRNFSVNIRSVPATNFSSRCAGKGKPPATAKRRNDDSDSDVDGAPMRSDSHPATPSSSSNATDKSKLPAGFVPSKWETIEPEEVQAQAITTASKWDLFDDGAAKGKKGITEPDDDDDEEDVDGVPLNHEENQLDLRVSEDRRAKLREIEIQVMKYQDELESGKQAVKSGWTISEQASLNFLHKVIIRIQ